MKRSIFRPASVYNPPIPFPMPEPQRGQAMRVIIAEAKRTGFPPALLVTTLQNPVPKDLYAARCHLVWLMSRIEGVTVLMLSRALRRDRHRVRDMIADAKELATKAIAGDSTPPTN